MVLNGNHRRFSVERAVRIFDQDAVGKLERTIQGKQDLTRCAELDHRFLEKRRFVPVCDG